jgi:citrate synthase
MTQANIQDKIQTAIDETIQVAQSNVQHATEQVHEPVQETVEAAAQVPVEALIGETVQVAQSNGHDAIEQAQQAVRATTQETVEQLQQTVDEVQEAVEQTAERTAEQTSAQVHAMMDIQKEVFAALQEMGQEWLEKAQSEMRLASEFSAKLSSLRSMPEITAAYRDWWKQRLNIMVEDSRRICENTEKLISTSGRYFGNGGEH